MLASVIDGMNEGGEGGTGARGVRRDSSDDEKQGNRNGTNMSSVLSIMEACWGDVAMVLSMPRQGLGDAAIASVANEEQLARFGKLWASMAITEPGFGSDSAAVSTTAVRDGDDYILNGEKIFVTAGGRSNAVVVWATRRQDEGTRRDQVLRRREGHARAWRSSGSSTSSASAPRTPRRSASPIAACRPRTCSARPTSRPSRASPASCRPSTTPVRSSPAWPSAAPAPRWTRSRTCCATAGVEVDYDRPAYSQSRGRRGLPADGGRLGGRLPAHARGDLDGRQPQAELAAGLDGQGEGRTVGRRHHAALRRAGRIARATARTRCWRSGRATRRSSTSSRARSRSSSSSSPAGCSNKTSAELK